MFYRVGDWDDLQIDLHVSLHVDFKIQFAGFVPVFLEFIGLNRPPDSPGRGFDSQPIPELRFSQPVPVGS